MQNLTIRDVLKYLKSERDENWYQEWFDDLLPDKSTEVIEGDCVIDDKLLVDLIKNYAMPSVWKKSNNKKQRDQMISLLEGMLTVVHGVDDGSIEVIRRYADGRRVKV